MLQVAGVLKTFQGVIALDHVTLSVRPGEVHALVGGNDAGKSTLVKVLSGVHQPDAGELRYRGEPVRFADPADARRAPPPSPGSRTSPATCRCWRPRA